jgi:glucosamine--fructose-6-phosphate aminotransferase (isomerizing)
MSSFREEVLAQPQALRDTSERLAASELPSTFPAGIQSGRWRKIVLTGMGSSYFALLPLHLRMVKQGLAAWLVETSELLDQYRSLLTPETLVIVASQSGASAEILHLLDAYGAEMTILGITNTPDSPLHSKTQSPVLMQAGSETSVSCKTYLATLMAQSWLGDQLLSEPVEFPALTNIASTVEAYLNHSVTFIDDLKEQLRDVRQLFFAGRGKSLAAAGTGGLTIKEAVRFPAEGLSSASFRHGPFEMAHSATFVVVFAGIGEMVPLNRRLAHDIVAAQGRAALVEVSRQSGAFTLPEVPEAALPIMEILPVQMMILALADLLNIEPGQFRLAKKITNVE